MDTRYIDRMPRVPGRSFFLFGPRGTGKSTWLVREIPSALRIDLLSPGVALELSADPDRLESMVGKRPAGSWIVLDEIQKLPVLLDVVHKLMEDRRWRFALCGSSARKLRRQGTNLLAGRAITRYLRPFSASEIGERFDLDRALRWGLLPVVWQDPEAAADVLGAYMDTYVREEIREESAVRNLYPFARFLRTAGQINGQVTNLQNIARETAVPRGSVVNYFSILEDTLLGRFLPAWQPRAKVREQSHPKFYWFDTGVARAAAGLLRDPADRYWLGNALETWVLHEVCVYNETQAKERPIAFYRTGGGAEIDFIIETRKGRPASRPHVVCIEVKLATKWDRRWERAARDLRAHPGVAIDRMIGVYTGSRAYHFDGFDVLPAEEFCARLHRGEIF